MQRAIGICHGRRRNVAVRRRIMGRRGCARNRAEYTVQRRRNALIAIRPVSSTNQSSAHAGIDRPRKCQSTFAHSPEPVSTWRTTSAKRAGVHHEIQRRAAGGDLVRRKVRSHTWRPAMPTPARAGISAMTPRRDARVAPRGANSPPIRNTRPSTANAMRWKMHSGHGLRCQWCCENSANPISAAHATKPIRKRRRKAEAAV